MNTLTLLGDRVLLQPVVEDKSKGGLMLPDNGKSNNTFFSVVALGPGKLYGEQRVPIDLNVGQKVFTAPQFGGEKVKIEGVEYTLVREQDILCKFEQ